MNPRLASVVMTCGLLMSANALAQTQPTQTQPTCPKGFQPYANRCVSQRMADYISCVEASGGNSERIAYEVSNADAGKTGVGVKASGSGVVAKGSGSITVDRATEKALASKFERTWTDKGMEECRKVLDPPKSPHHNTTPSASHPQQQPTATRPPTLRDLFKSDFSNVMKFTDDSCEIQWKDGTKSGFSCQAYLDFEGKSEFVGFYVPSSQRTFDICLRLQDAPTDVVRKVPEHAAITGGYRDEATSLKDLVFTGRVFLYHDDILTITQKAAIIEAYRQRGLDVNFRGPDYLGDQVIAWYHQHDSKPQ
jgi:hypothetical protein